MAFDTKVRKLWAVLAIPAVLLAIGAGYKRGGLEGLRELGLDTLQSVGLYREEPTRGGSDLSSHQSVSDKSSVTPSTDEVFWLTIRESRTIGLFEEFLKKFPDSPHAREARAKLDELEKGQRSRKQSQPQMPMRDQGRGPTMMPPDAPGPRPDGGK
jgi:hypothetical protein